MYFLAITITIFFFFQIIESRVEHYNTGAFYDDIEDHKQALKNVLNIKEN